MSKIRDFTHKSKLLRQVVTSSLEVLKNREDGYIFWIVKMLSFLEIEVRLDNLSVHFSSVSVILCLGGKIGVIVTLTDYMFLDERLSVYKNVTAILFFDYREQLI